MSGGEKGKSLAMLDVSRLRHSATAFRARGSVERSLDSADTIATFAASRLRNAWQSSESIHYTVRR